MELRKIQKRISEIKKEIHNMPKVLHERHKDIGITQGQLERLCEKNIKPLKDELDILESEKQFKFQLLTMRASWFLILATLFVAFVVPWYQRIQEGRAEIQAVYKNLIVNQDIFISNSNNIREINKGGKISDLPESFIEDNISREARRVLQDTLGLVQYRFFLYYFQQTVLMNEEIEQMINYSIITNAESLKQINPTGKYLKTMEYLSLENWDTKLNYQKDTECLQYFFEHSFLYIKPDGRGKAPECDYWSLERLFNHFGYLEADTPRWLKIQLREALNHRESGLGDRLIQL